VAFYWLNEDDQDRSRKVNIFAAIETYTFEKVVENFFKALGKNIIEDIGTVHHTEVLDLLDNPEVIS
jgi:AAA15 family ATPase/GTPase